MIHVLFLLYINGYLNRLSCDSAIPADDLNTWRPIKYKIDVQGLQNIIKRLSNWFKVALARFNTNRFVVLKLHFRITKKSYAQRQLSGECERDAQG